MAAEKRLGNQSSDGSSSDGEVPFRSVMRIPFDEKNLTCWKFQMETQLFLIDALEIARGNVFTIPVPRHGITRDDKARLQRYNKKVKRRKKLGFHLLVQSMGGSAQHQSVISSNCEIGDLAGAWKAIWDKYDSKKPAMQSQLATDFANCIQMPGETIEQFLNRINEICARMVNDPGDAMKKTQVIKGVEPEYYSFANQEARKDMSWSDFCASMKDQAMQSADISLFREKRKLLIAQDLAKKKVRTAADEDIEVDQIREDLVNFASNRQSEKGKPALECWTCGKKGHKSFECPKKQKKTKEERKKKKKHRVRVEDSEASSSDSD